VDEEEIPGWADIRGGGFANLEGGVQSASSQVPAFCLLQDLDIIQVTQLLLCHALDKALLLQPENPLLEHVLQAWTYSSGQSEPSSKTVEILLNGLLQGMVARRRNFEAHPEDVRSVYLQGKPPLVVVTGKIGGNEVQLSLELRRNEARKGSGDRNAAVLRSNVYRYELLERFRRKLRPHPVTEFVAGCFGGRSPSMEGFFVCFQTTETNGYLALDLVLSREFSAETRRLTDRFRCLTLSLFDAVERLHASGWRFVHFLLWTLSWNPVTNHMKLVHLPFGTIVKPDEAPCDKGSTKRKAVGMGPRRTTSVCAASGGKPPVTVDQKRFKALLGNNVPTGFPAVYFTESNVRRSWSDNVHLSTGMIVPEGCRFIDDKSRPIPDGALKGAVVEPDPEQLRVTDMQQIMLRIVEHFVGSSHGGDWVEKLRSLLEGAVEFDRLVDGMVGFLDPKAEAVQQPLARRRLASFVANGLTQSDVRRLSSNLFPTLPVLTPDQEVLVCPGGVGLPMFANVNVFPRDKEFERKACNSLRDIEGVAELWSNPRQVLLMDEPGKGLGVFGLGRFEAGTFAMFYMARDVKEPSGRYIVAIKVGQTGPYADGAPCIELPMETFIERGTPGCFVNAEKGVPNLALRRDRAFRHNNLWFIPMIVLHTFANAFTGFNYEPDAEKGCNRSCGEGAGWGGVGL
jgi:hypothetical protein